MTRPLVEPTQTRQVATNTWGVGQLERRVLPGPWHYVGEAGEPGFQNSWGNATGNDPLRFRNSGLGPPDIEGSIDGGTSGTVVFTIPANFLLEARDIPFAGTSTDPTIFSTWLIDYASGDVTVWLSA